VNIALTPSPRPAVLIAGSAGCMLLQFEWICGSNWGPLTPLKRTMGPTLPTTRLEAVLCVAGRSGISMVMPVGSEVETSLLTAEEASRGQD